MQMSAVESQLCHRCAVLAYVIAALSPTMEVANGALPAYVVTLLFFVGLLICADNQPRYWHW